MGGCGTSFGSRLVRDLFVEDALVRLEDDVLPDERDEGVYTDPVSPALTRQADQRDAPDDRIKHCSPES